MTALATSQPLVTPEEFLAWEREQEGRYELIDGELLVTPAPSYDHQEAGARLCEGRWGREGAPPIIAARRSGSGRTTFIPTSSCAVDRVM